MLGFLVFICILAIIIKVVIGSSKSKKESILQYPYEKQSREKECKYYKRHVDYSSLMPDYAVIDTETTELNSKSGKLLEISVVIYRNHSEQEARTWRINPGVHISEEISKMTGIYDENVKDMPCFSDISDEILDFIKGYIIVGYLISYDRDILEKEIGKPLLNDTFDVYWLARNSLPSATDYSFTAIARWMGISTKDAGTTLGNCIITHKMLTSLLEAYEAVGEYPDLTPTHWGQ